MRKVFRILAGNTTYICALQFSSGVATSIYKKMEIIVCDVKDWIIIVSADIENFHIFI